MTVVAHVSFELVPFLPLNLICQYPGAMTAVYVRPPEGLLLSTPPGAKSLSRKAKLNSAERGDLLLPDGYPEDGRGQKPCPSSHREGNGPKPSE